MIKTVLLVVCACTLFDTSFFFFCGKIYVHINITASAISNQKHWTNDKQCNRTAIGMQHYNTKKREIDTQ